MLRSLAALALSAWLVSGLFVAPALLLRRWRAGRRWYAWALVLFMAVQVLRVISLVSDPAPVFPDGWLAELDLEAEGLLREGPMWLFGLAGVALLADLGLRRLSGMGSGSWWRGPSREGAASRDPGFELVIGLYGLGFLFQQLAVVCANGRFW